MKESELGTKCHLCQNNILSAIVYYFNAVFGVWSRAEITELDRREFFFLHETCNITCPMKEQRVCTVESNKFAFAVFLNKCFLWGMNKCGKKRKYQKHLCLL